MKSTTANLNQEITEAQSRVNQFSFGTQEWEDAMQVVRDLTGQQTVGYAADVPQHRILSAKRGGTKK